MICPSCGGPVIESEFTTLVYCDNEECHETIWFRHAIPQIALDQQAEISRLRSDLARMKGALEVIRDHEHCKEDKCPWPYPAYDSFADTQFRSGLSTGHRCCAAIAAKTLEGK